MSKIPDTSDAQEFQVHDEGGPYGFVVKSVVDHASKNCPPEQHFDSLKITLRPAQKGDGRANIMVFIPRSGKSWPLKQLCIACGFDPKGGFDSEKFIGRSFQAHVVHNEYNGKTYANIDWKSLSEYNGETDEIEQDEDLPF